MKMQISYICYRCGYSYSSPCISRKKCSEQLTTLIFLTYTQLCLATLERPLVQPWRPWKVNGQIAGYVEVWTFNQRKIATKFGCFLFQVYDKYTYATVKGAGHEVSEKILIIQIKILFKVPSYQPWSAFHMFQRFLTGQPL